MHHELKEHLNDFKVKNQSKKKVYHKDTQKLMKGLF